jgi:hypothetical protein
VLLGDGRRLVGLSLGLREGVPGPDVWAQPVVKMTMDDKAQAISNDLIVFPSVELLNFNHSMAK